MQQERGPDSGRAYFGIIEGHYPEGLDSVSARLGRSVPE